MRGDEPRRALLLTLGITVVIILWAGEDSEGGAFNILAAVVAMFFLYTYGMVNLAAFIEIFAANPSFRPRFKYCHWVLSLLGAAGCAAAAFLINFKAASIAAALLIMLYVYLRRKMLEVRFGDARWGFFYSRLRDNVFRLARMPLNSKNWRPTILVLVGSPEARRAMAMYALWIGEGRGLVILSRIIVGDLSERAKLRKPALDQLNVFLDENRFDALSSVVVCNSLDEGLKVLIQGHPIGPLGPNIVMMGWPDQDNFASFLTHIHSIRLLGLSSILFRDKGLPKSRENRTIDVWWRGRENGFLMLLVSHLMTLNWEWSQAKIRLLRVIKNEEGRQPATQALNELANAARVDVEVQLIVSDDSFCEVVHRHSGNASTVILGFSPPEEKDAQRFRENIEKILAGLPTTLLVCSAGEADLLA